MAASTTLSSASYDCVIAAAARVLCCCSSTSSVLTMLCLVGGLLELMGVPDGFTGVLKSWAALFSIPLLVGDDLQPSSFPQGGVLSPILFNIVLKVLLRFVNARAAELGVVSFLMLLQELRAPHVSVCVYLRLPLQTMLCSFAQTLKLLNKH
jgi:hypothetical protein